MAIKVGDKLPDAKFMVFKDAAPAQITGDEVFKGKRVALFAVPGAFTPTCSAKHLPGVQAACRRPEEERRRHDRLRLCQ